MPPGVVEVLLGVDLDVTAGRIDVGEGLARLDHLLEELDQVRLLEGAGLVERAAAVLLPAALVMSQQPARPFRRSPD